MAPVFKGTLSKIHYAMTRKPDILDMILEHPLNISPLNTLLVC